MARLYTSGRFSPILAISWWPSRCPVGDLHEVLPGLEDSGAVLHHLYDY